MVVMVAVLVVEAGLVVVMMAANHSSAVSSSNTTTNSTTMTTTNSFSNITTFSYTTADAPLDHHLLHLVWRQRRKAAREGGVGVAEWPAMEGERVEWSDMEGVREEREGRSGC